VLNIEQQPVTIKTIERAIIDRAMASGPLPAVTVPVKSGKRVAVIGSGPAGLAAAQQLARRGHDVTVLEAADAIGGLLRYGIPDFKLEKEVLDWRLRQMTAEGVTFKTKVHCGVDVSGVELKASYDALVLAGGAMKPRDLPVPGRQLEGVHYAMDFLTQQNRRVAGLPVTEAPILATDKRVVVLGGGDTGSDCVGTSLRQGARHVQSLELMPRPPDARAPLNPWPQWPLIYRTSSSHEEGGDRDFAVMTKRLIGDERGRVKALEAVRVKMEGGKLTEQPGSELTIPCELVLLAMGFTGPVRAGLLEQLGVAVNERGNVATTHGRTSVEGVFAAGDMARGQSLVVWAIAEGRKVATEVDNWLRTGL
jgi:glutamate synthase (NADPH/NADH) small chain